MQRILSLYEKCRAAEFGFAAPEFCELLEEVVRRSLGERRSATERTQFLETLHTDELVLARACARGHEGAWERFFALYREKLFAAALIMTREECAAQELADSLHADLFGVRVGSDGQRKSKLESYLGRGSLEGWLRTVLAQAYVNRFRRDRKLIAFEEAIDTGTKASCGDEPSEENRRLAQSTDAAIADLSDEERFLLKAYYLDERTLAEIGRALSVHESTVSRRLEKITGKLRKRILGRLCSDGISKRAAEEMLKADVRNLGVDVRDRLMQGRPA